MVWPVCRGDSRPSYSVIVFRLLTLGAASVGVSAENRRKIESQVLVVKRGRGPKRVFVHRTLFTCTAILLIGCCYCECSGRRAMCALMPTHFRV